MSEATMVTSIAATRDDIGMRAARHLDMAFRAIMRPNRSRPCSLTDIQTLSARNWRVSCRP